LLQKNGSYYESSGDIGDVMGTTSQASIALAGKALPIPPAGDVVTDFAPQFGSVTPAAGARFATSTVLVRAAYQDNPNGTGIATSGIRITLDGAAKTKAASIQATRLTLKLTKLTNGSHTVVIAICDRAGNATRIQRKFTVAVPVASSSSSGEGDTHSGSGGSSTGSGGSSTSSSAATVHHSASSPTPLATLTPAVTLTPTPFSASSGGSASPSPGTSVTRRVAGASHSDGRGKMAAVVGTTLLVLLPLGFVGPWLVHRRLLGVMDSATWGEILPPRSSVWRRFWRSGGSPPSGDWE
jgi:hypothetical protein